MARAKPSWAMIASSFACALVRAASVATIAMVVLSPGRPLATGASAMGGTAAGTELTARDREICARLGPELKRRGLLFTGIDVIGPYLTEINVTSPTGIRHVQALGGPDIPALIWDAIEAKVAAR